MTKPMWRSKRYTIEGLTLADVFNLQLVGAEVRSCKNCEHSPDGGICDWMDYYGDDIMRGSECTGWKWRGKK